MKIDSSRLLRSSGTGLATKNPPASLHSQRHQADVLGQQVHLADAVERVLGAALIRVLAVGRLLAPLVDQRRRNLQRGGDRFDARLIDGLADDFEGFHRGEACYRKTARTTRCLVSRISAAIASTSSDGAESWAFAKR